MKHFAAVGWLAGSLLLGAGSAAAEPVGSADLPFVERFPEARIVDFGQQAVTERLYPMDGLRRISGRLRMDRHVVADGELTAITYRLPDHHSGLEAFTLARQQLLAGDAQLLYWCEGRDCGSSSLWANSIFDISSLYGPEGNQGYLLARVPGSPDRLLALYAITRGNGRAYLQVEALEPAAPLGQVLPTAGTLLRQLREADELRLAHLPSEPLADWAAVLARTLRLDSSLRVALAGAGAAQWREALIAEDIRPLRMEIDAGDSQGLTLRRLR